MIIRVINYLHFIYFSNVLLVFLQFLAFCSVFADPSMAATSRSSSINDTLEETVTAMLTSLSTSYGPKGLDKMIVRGKDVVVTNDGATILKNYNSNPFHRIISGMSQSQDTNCGDGTTSVVLLLGSVMEKLCALKRKGIHSSRLVSALEIAKSIALNYIDNSKIKIEKDDYIKVALTTLSSKIAAKSVKMAEVAVEALESADLSDIKIFKHVGGNLDEIEFIKGTLIKSAKHDLNDDDLNKNLTGKRNILLIKFCISAPKTNMESKIIIDDYSLMEKFIKEEREYVINLIKAIKTTGASLIVVQKSILRESVSELARHFLNKLGIGCIDGVENKEMNELERILGIKGATDVELLDKPIEVETKVRNGMLEIKNYGKSIIVSGCDQIIVDEAERSLHDALCVIKGLMDEPYVVPGGGSIETGIATALLAHSGANSVIVNEIGDGFIALPHYIAKNAGLYSVELVSQLKRMVLENKSLGISLRTGYISDMVNNDNVIQPAVVSKSTVVLALETAQVLIRIDDILPTRN